MNPGPTGCSRRENFTLRETAIRGPRVPAPSAGCPAVQITDVSKGRARPVPAAAVTPAARVVAVIIGFKGSVAGLLSLLGNLATQSSGVQEILVGLGPGEVGGTPGVGVKSRNPWGTTDGEGIPPERVRR